MIFRLGYVAMTLNLVDCSPSKTVTVTTLKKVDSDTGKIHRLRKTAKENIVNTLRILRYNKAYNINVYRLTSKLIPLATHAFAEGWDYIADLKGEFKETGDFIKENNFRISAHPDHYTLINSPSAQVVADAVKDLEYHCRVYEAMGLEDYRYKLVMHVGGLYGDKKTAVERFKENFIRLPEHIRKRIILENDDKSFTAIDVLGICNDLGIPMVVDIHHHNCISEGEKIEDILGPAFNTWKDEYFNPKIHFSSPKSDREFRSHAGDIDFNAFCRFLDAAASVGQSFDVMLEAKNKDSALLKLSHQLEEYNGVRKINEAEFELLNR